MKLLVVTQAVDSENPVLGFFVRWLEELAVHYESLEVICLTEGKHELPENVRVYSLGKERGRPLLGSLAYAARFLALAWRLRARYDAVFVHMNQEYILLAGWLWKLLGKPIYLWRNHYAGDVLTVLAVALSTKVFCTSKHSYTARFKKTDLMPVGVDTSRFKPGTSAPRSPHSILFFARMAPSKRPEMLLDALAMLARDGADFIADFVGSPLPEDAPYYELLKVQAEQLGNRVHFLPAVANDAAPRLYQSHEIFVNCSPSGMLDKTIFEAAACGCAVLASSQDWADLAGQDGYFDTPERLAERLAAVLADAQQPSSVEGHDLLALVSRLVEVMK